MDRRGSGIGRIINSYTDFIEKPVFYSNEFYFQVVLPNRSVADPAQMNLDLYHKSQLSDEKTQLTSRKLNSDKDWELIYFKEKLIEQIDHAFRNKTINQIEQLFSRYRYDYSFNRRNIAEMFSISENGASGFIKKCLDKKIIRKEKIDSYRFVNKQSE